MRKARERVFYDHEEGTTRLPLTLRLEHDGSGMVRRHLSVFGWETSILRAMALPELSPPPRSADDTWKGFELELERLLVAEFHSEPVLTVTAKKNCHLICWICRLSGGKAGAGVRCLFRLPRRGAFGTKLQGTP